MRKVAAILGLSLAVMAGAPALAATGEDVVVMAIPERGVAASALMARDYERAARHLQAVWPDNINDPARLINLGNAYAGMGRMADARKAYKAVSHVPDMVLVLANGTEESSRSIASRAARRIEASYAMR